MSIDAKGRRWWREDLGTAGNSLRYRTIRGSGTGGTWKRVSANGQQCAIEFRQKVKGGGRRAGDLGEGKRGFIKQHMTRYDVLIRG
jgi:hypothetical protein